MGKQVNMSVRASAIAAIATLAVLIGCSTQTKEDGTAARIVVYGDSMMDWNSERGASTPDALAKLLNEPVENRALTAARISHPYNPLFDIRKQEVAGPWDVAIVNGGANDMLLECGCGPCARNLTRLISKDGQTGQIPDFLRKLQSQGTHVIFTGYHRPRQMNTPLRGCGDEIDVLETRIRKLSATEPNISFARLDDVFPAGDTSFYDVDRFHPSEKGSAVMAQALLPYVQKALEPTSEPDGG